MLSQFYVNKNIMNSKYSIIKQIGQGQYGQIFLATSNRKFAIKKINSQNIDAEHILLPQINHPNILRVHQIIPQQRDICIVLEFAAQDLSTYVAKNFSEEYIPQKLIKSWLLQLCLALYHLHHEISLIHRDIKTINVLVMEDGLIKLSDFGLAKKMTSLQDFAKSTVGTPYYLSPQTVSLGRFNIKSDVWGLGCLMYELCTGEKPFKGTAFGQIFNNIVNGIAGQLPECYSGWLSHLILSMLQKNEEKRPTVEAILEDEEMRKQFIRLKSMHKEYECFPYPKLNLKTTKYLEREDRLLGNIKLFSQSLKTVKKERPIKIHMEEGWGQSTNITEKQKKVERIKFADQSLRSLLSKPRLNKDQK